MTPQRFAPGSVVVLREIWGQSIWGAHPMIVVQDSPDLIAIYRPAGAHSMRRSIPAGKNVTARQRRDMDWTLADVTRDDISTLRLTVPGEAFSVFAFFHSGDFGLRCWYINLEDPQSRTPMGFDHRDCILDLIVEPDLKDWRWDDEDELQEAVSLGLFSEEQARTIYAKGKEVRDLIMSGTSLFNPWAAWRPEPSWGIPELPENWDDPPTARIMH